MLAICDNLQRYITAKTEELCDTLMGSKTAIIRRNNLHQIPEYGYCKGNVKSKRLMEFLQHVILKGCFLKENLRSVDDRVRPVYIPVGEVRDLLAGSTKVLYCK